MGPTNALGKMPHRSQPATFSHPQGQSAPAREVVVPFLIVPQVHESPQVHADPEDRVIQSLTFRSHQGPGAKVSREPRNVMQYKQGSLSVSWEGWEGRWDRE